MTRAATHTLLLLFTGAAFLRPADVSNPVLTVAEGLFDPSQAPTLGLKEAPSTETFTIFAPRDNTDKFSNGVQIYPFKGWLYAMWQSTPKDEDTSNGCVVWSRSRDGERWTPPAEMAGPVGDGKHMRSGGGFWSYDGVLVAYIQKVDSWYPGKEKITEARTSRDGTSWSPLRTVSKKGAMAENVKALPSGRLLTVAQGHLPGSPKMIGLPFISDRPDGLDAWRLIPVPQPPSRNAMYGRGIEPSWYLRDDGRPVMVFRDSDQSGFVLASLGDPTGEAWTMPARVAMPDSASMQCAGNLPGGTVYLVNNPIAKTRIPLAVTLSRNGRHFDRAFLLRAHPQPRRYEGKAKGPGFSYPGAAVWKGYLYVAYATNKEDAEVTRVPLKSLEYRTRMR